MISQIRTSHIFLVLGSNSANTQPIMNSELLRIYHPEKANMLLDESKFVEKCNNEEQLQNPSEEMTQQDTTEAVSKPVQVTSQKRKKEKRMDKVFQ